jgi:pilus assembly protein Flp/PilA
MQENTMSKIFLRIFKNNSGATAIEYGLIAALIGVALITGAEAIGLNLGNTFTHISDTISNASGTTTGTTGTTTETTGGNG